MKIGEMGVEEGDRIAAAEVDDDARANLARRAKHLCEGIKGGPITFKPYLVLCRGAGGKVSDEIISKTEYWQWLDDKTNAATPAPTGTLKHIQDTLILSVLKDLKGKKILEFGGGESRILKQLSKDNECWNVDKFEATDGGPRRVFQQRKVKTVKAYLGEFNDDIPSDYFDYVVSISVAEHVSHCDLERVFADCARVLKPGGNLVQAIDLYLPDAIDKDDKAFQFNRPRLTDYLHAAEKAGLMLKEPAAIDGDAYFRGFHASNSDATLYHRNKGAPKLRAIRERGQSVSLKSWWVKPPTR